MKPRMVPHHKDPWADEIVLNGIRSFRLVIRERYKTSGLSGDEWRFSYIWQMQSALQWDDLDGPYARQESAVAAFFPAFRTSHPDWCDELCYSIQFSWKGQPLAEMSDDGKPVPMLHAIGTIAWAEVMACENVEWRKDDGNVCAQPGCRELPISLFRKVRDYYPRVGQPRDHYDGNQYRRFCQRHLRRGDCGLDDADSNYELIDGIGPEGNEPDPSVVKPAVFGGIVR